jgi:hypothetical protein
MVQSAWADPIEDNQSQGLNPAGAGWPGVHYISDPIQGGDMPGVGWHHHMNVERIVGSWLTAAEIRPS